MDQVNIGMIGGGTVGSGVFHALQLNGGLMASRIFWISSGTTGGAASRYAKIPAMPHIYLTATHSRFWLKTMPASLWPVSTAR